MIYLVRIGALDLPHRLFESVLIPESVKVEVVDRGLKIKAPDALAIKHALETTKWLKVKKLTTTQKLAAKRLSENTLIDVTDGEAIILARNMKVPLLVDDREAVAVCRLEGIETIGTLGVIVRAAKMNIITKKSARKFVDTLVDQGFYLSVEVYREAVKMLSG
jgi:predicted nucleic acid-binding protein